MPPTHGVLPLIDHLDINKVYYITDSPMSQYRNKFIINIVSCHQLIFRMPAVWHYFEKGHAKGPCDVIGGAVKRSASQAAKHGVPMADAHQLYDWALQHEGGISFVMISRFESNHTEADVTLFEKRLQPLSNTLSLHSIRSGQRTGDVEWQETSCNCVGCLACKSSCEYHCVSVLKPPTKGRGKRLKLGGTSYQL